MLSGSPVVSAHGLSKRYGQGQLALDGLDLDLRPGELVGFLGPSGAGKTTLFRLINGSIRPTAGELEVLGTPMATVRGGQLRRLRRSVAMVPQGHGLIPTLTAAQNVLLGTLGQLSGPAALRRLLYLTEAERRLAFETLDRVGLADKLYARVDQLSGGQQQRVAVARSLIQNPQLLLADEPVASVDPDTAKVLMEVFRALVSSGQTVLVSLHQTSLANEYCSRIITLTHGKLVHDSAGSLSLDYSGQEVVA